MASSSANFCRKTPHRTAHLVLEIKRPLGAQHGQRNVGVGFARSKLGCCCCVFRSHQYALNRISVVPKRLHHILVGWRGRPTSWYCFVVGYELDSVPGFDGCADALHHVSKGVQPFSVATCFMATPVRKWTPERHAICHAHAVFSIGLSLVSRQQVLVWCRISRIQ